MNYFEKELKMRQLRHQGYTYVAVRDNDELVPGYHHSMIEMILDILERQRYKSEHDSTIKNRIDRVGGI